MGGYCHSATERVYWYRQNSVVGTRDTINVPRHRQRIGYRTSRDEICISQQMSLGKGSTFPVIEIFVLYRLYVGKEATEL